MTENIPTKTEIHKNGP